MKIVAMVALIFSTVYASSFERAASHEDVEIIQEGEGKEWCPICGMKLKAYYKTNHAVKLSDGIKKQYCSIRCLAYDYAAVAERIDQILVVDANTEKLIDVKDAYYVLGSKAPGTMTVVSKYAFAKKSDAEQFIDNYGGELVNFQTAFQSAMDSLESDARLTQQRKEQRMYPMGERLYEMRCQEIDLMRFSSINQLKDYIAAQSLCGALQESQLQAVALYLWEVKRFEHSHVAKIDVPEDAKCPVCGMFVAKYPQWAAVITHHGHSHYFDGAKDMFKYYFEPRKYSNHDLGDDAVIYVTDYYTLEAVRAQDAYYVIGSTVTGPMGHEFIPFASKNAAQEFQKDYRGAKVLRFDEIKIGDATKLDHGNFDL